MSGVRIGVDLGGTKIECVALAANGEVVLRRRRQTPKDRYQDTIMTIADLVAEVEAGVGQGPLRVGLGTPGSISPFTGLLRNSNSVHMNGHPFQADLAEALAGRALRVENDANCFAMSEAADGAAAGAGVVFGVIIGTGVGGGIVVGGKVLSGANGVAGEWGHNKLPGPDAAEAATPPCWCGRQGCLETWLSGPALAKDHLRHTGDSLLAAEIALSAAGGDTAATETLARYADRLGRACASVVNLIDPDVIVLGGGVSNIAGLADKAAEAMRAHVFSDDIVTRIVPNLHGDSSGVRGAAWLWPLEDVCGENV